MAEACEFKCLKIRGLLLPLILLFVVIIILSSFESSINGFLSDILFSYVFYAIFALWILWKLRKTKVDFNKLLGKYPKKKDLPNILLITVLLIIFSIATVIIGFYAVSFINPDLINELLVGKPDISASYPAYYNILNFLIIVLIAPIVEEILFRGSNIQ